MVPKVGVIQRGDCLIHCSFSARMHMLNMKGRSAGNPAGTVNLCAAGNSGRYAVIP